MTLDPLYQIHVDELIPLHLYRIFVWHRDHPDTPSELYCNSVSAASMLTVSISVLKKELNIR
jgi:hypothetical protein